MNKIVTQDGGDQSAVERLIEYERQQNRKLHDWLVCKMRLVAGSTKISSGDRLGPRF